MIFKWESVAVICTKKKNSKQTKQNNNDKKTFSCSLEQFLKSLFSETIMPLFNLLDVHPGRLNS